MNEKERELILKLLEVIEISLKGMRDASAALQTVLNKIEPLTKEASRLTDELL